MNKILLILLLISMNVTYSQFVPEWVQIQSQTNLNIDNSNLSAIDASGNIYVANAYNNAGNSNIILTKFNNTGNILWQEEYNSSAPENQDYPKKLIFDQSGNIIVLGNANSQSYLDNKIFIIKYSTTGTLVNSIEYKRPGNPITIGIDIAKDSNGNLIIAGSVDNQQTFIDSTLIAKFDQSLNIQWIKTSRDTNMYYNFIQSVKIDPANNIYASGKSGISMINMKYDNSGNTIWFRKYFNTQSLYSNHQSPVSFLDNNQNLYVCDSKLDIAGNDTTKTLLLKYNSAGVLQWANIYNVSNDGTEGPRRIFSDNNSIYLDINYYNDSYLVKINSSGQFQWQKNMDHQVYYMNLDQSGSIITTGFKNTYNRKEVCMERFTSAGTMDISYTYSNNGTGFDQAMWFLNTTDSKILIGGYHNSSVMFLKLTPSMTQSISQTRNNLNKAILDNQNTYDTISFSAGNLPLYTQIKAVYVNIDTILHSSDGDLQIMLIHQNYTDTLIINRGGFFDNFIGTKLRDTSVSPICNSNSAPFTGYFSPCYPLAQFNNLSPAGTWILKIYDRRTPDTGFLKAWSITVVYEVPIGINQISIEIPEKYNLKQNYPNPFNPNTKIRFSLPKSTLTKIIVYDILGKEIETLVDHQLNAGIYETNFKASNLSSGIYFYKLTTEDFTETKKMLLIK